MYRKEDAHSFQITGSQAEALIGVLQDHVDGEPVLITTQGDALNIVVTVVVPLVVLTGIAVIIITEGRDVVIAVAAYFRKLLGR
jgi:hypothetical protein